MNVKSLFKFRSRRRTSEPSSSDSRVPSPSPDAIHGSKSGAHGTHTVEKVWRFVLPVLLGLTFGWLAMVCLGVFLTQAGFVVVRGPIINNISENGNSSEERGMEEFLAANPFRVSPLVVEVPEPVVVSEDPGPKIIGSLATAVVKGTFPDVGVWLEDKGETRLLLIGSSFDVYTLESVSYREAVFVKNDDIVVLEMNFGVPTVKTASTGTGAARAPSSGARSVNTPVGDVIPAVPGEQDGAVPSGLVNDLVQNPFDELKKVRLRPKDGQSGLEIQWIQDDSILGQLGVQKGDIVKAVNGIAFTNMADIANSINSLMNSERFDVEVERDGKTTALRYVVR